MKRVLLFSLGLLLVSSLAFAQGGAIGIYTSMAGTDCYLQDIAPGLATYWIVHQLTPGATAAQFSAPQPGCFVAAYLSDTAVYAVTLGNSQTGVAIGYGFCVPSPNAVLGINYFVNGITLPCCPYPVLPDPLAASGTIEVVDCGGNLITGVFGGTGMINGNPTDCICDGVIAVEETTWGRVKSLYSAD